MDSSAMAATDEDLRQIWCWNATVPRTVDTKCIHEVIAETTLRQLDAKALEAWDGNFTYSELDRLSSQVAQELHSRGVTPGAEATVIPLCFEKSKWTSVAMLGIMKAGGISVALDVSQPAERLTSIVEQTQAKFILCSSTSKEVAGLVSDSAALVEIGDGFPSLHGDSHEDKELPRRSPEQTAFVTYTSGSTGTPKGACISHANVCAAVHYQGQKLGFNSRSRVLDFAPYSFDVAWSNMLHTFTAGGCLCIPSENDMLSDLASCVDRYNVSLVNITPTILRTFNRCPASLKTVLLSGEPPDLDLLSKWASKVRLHNTYGPAECTFKSAFAEISSTIDTRASNIGKCTGACSWIVDPEDPYQLVSIGEVGELWLEGPLVGQGYLHDAEKTASAFVQNPSWLMRGNSQQIGRKGRLYRTGDLVRYASDGSLVFTGRKDRQVKIRGGRVELGDVEHHVRRALDGSAAEEIVAEAIIPQGSDSTILVIFHTSEKTNGIDEKLAKVLPGYMIPSAYVHVSDAMPRTGTGKTDRRRLREMGASMTLEQLTSRKPTQVESRRPCSPLETRLQHLWATVLSVKVGTIGVDDSFFQNGGDSIKAIRLVAAARQQGLSFTVKDVFGHPRLSELATVAREDSHAMPDPVRAFSLLRHCTESQAREIAATECGVDASRIEDIFPCTPFQAGLMALTARRPGDYVSTRSLVLKSTIDLDRLEAACIKVVLAAPILRTRIVSLKGEGVMQVIVGGSLGWSNSADISAAIKLKKNMGLGTQLARFCFATEQSTGRRLFVWTMHHALFDGWSRSLLLDMLSKAYNGDEIGPSPPYHSFVQHTTSLPDNPEAVDAWKDRFRGLEAQVFPALPSNEYQPRASQAVTHSIEKLQWPRSNITPSTLVQTAWALLVEQYTSSSDVIFGSVVTGRDAPVVGVECMTGPTAATIPQRIALGRDERVEELLARVQEGSMKMKPFEQMGLSSIRRVSVEAEQACDFQTLLVLHPIDTEKHEESLLFEDIGGDALTSQADLDDGANTYGLMMACQLEKDGLRVTANLDPAVIDQSFLERMLQQLEHVLRQLCCKDSWDNKVVEISMLSDRDLKDIQSWNASVPESVPALVHHLLAETAEKQKDDLAIHAWDGDLTYGQLDTLSTRLAQNLLYHLRVLPDEVIPLCFEKSMWTSVAILGVMKAGAASLAFDVTQPEQRLRSIVDQVRPRVVLASPQNLALARSLCPGAISIDSLLTEQAPQPFIFPSVQPTNACFLVFTSGSTGKPKGIVVTHENFCSALVHHTKALGFDGGTRVFDFASYAFDAAYYNLLHTLHAGGCLCVPSDFERHNDLSRSICRLGATFANLTPKVAELLDNDALKQLRLVELSGETADARAIARMREHTNVRFVYGPAECSVLSTVSANDAAVCNIGRGLGVCCWVVDCRNPKTLTPVGVVGELWLEGPLVCQGYFEDGDKTAATFVNDPVWLDEVAGRKGRLYRTGDLVRYSGDGSLIFVGRKDTQTKIRGQRVELAEVAHHVQQCLASAAGAEMESATALAEVAMPYGGSVPLLAAFVIPGKTSTTNADEWASVVSQMTIDCQKRMGMVVPSYMVPSLFIPLQSTPLTATGKIDRGQLRSVIQNFRPELPWMSPSPETWQTKLTETEQRLRVLWVRVLHIEEDQIRQDSSFWDVGDSITAMSLLVAVRNEFQVDFRISSLTRQNATLEGIGMMIEDAKLGRVHEAKADIRADLAKMSKDLGLAACIEKQKPLTVPASKRRIALLTGSTGFLGTQILCDMLASRRFEKVIVLVRASDASAGLERVRRTAKVAGWWVESAAQAIEVWVGDLSKSRLGLIATQWGRLSGESPQGVDTIIHNGAAVHWTSDYQALRAVNVDSTFQLLKAAVQSPLLRRFVYVSGGRASDDKEDARLVEDDDASGYVKTKYVSESLVLGLAESPLQPAGKFTVAKPGLIIGGAETGIANVDDFLWRYVRTCIKLQAFPTEPTNAWIPVVEVTRVSAKILNQVVATEADSFTSMKSGLLLAQFWEAVQNGLGRSLSKIDMRTWLDAVKTSIQQEKEAHPLWPVQQFLGGLGVDNLACSYGPQSLEEIKKMRRLELAVARNVEYLQQTGAAAAYDGEGEIIDKDLMTRSRIDSVFEYGHRDTLL